MNAIDLPRSHVLSYDATDRAHYRRSLGSLPRRLVAPVLARICERSRPRCAAVPKPSTTARQRFSTSCSTETAVRRARRAPARRAHRGRLVDVPYVHVRSRYVANVARDGGASNDFAFFVARATIRAQGVHHGGRFLFPPAVCGLRSRRTPSSTTAAHAPLAAASSSPCCSCPSRSSCSRHCGCASFMGISRVPVPPPCTLTCCGTGCRPACHGRPRAHV